MATRLVPPMDRSVLQRVLDVSRVMAETRALTPLLNHVMDEAISLVGAEQGYLVLLGANGSRRVRLTRPQPEDGAPDSADQVSNSIINEVVATGQPLLIRDAGTHPKFGNANSVIQLKLRSVICVPLISRGNLLGVLYVENRQLTGRFKVNDLAPLVLFANQVAISIENAGLNDELESRVLQRTRELQETTQQIESSWANLVETNRLQTEMLANVTHDLRTPLTIVLGTLSAMEEGTLGELTPVQREWVQQSLNALNQVLSLTNDIFDLTKLDLGGLAFYPKSINLNEFLSEIFKIGLGLRWPDGVTPKLDLGPRLPSVTVDPVRVRQILLNLISNAIKYTTDGTITLHAHYIAEQHEVWIGVADTGEGLAPHQTGRLFNRFAQTDSNFERRRQGTGLGLAISKQLVEMHQGRIWMENVLPHGANFIFALPV